MHFFILLFSLNLLNQIILLSLFVGIKLFSDNFVENFFIKSFSQIRLLNIFIFFLLQTFLILLILNFDQPLVFDSLFHHNLLYFLFLFIPFRVKVILYVVLLIQFLLYQFFEHLFFIHTDQSCMF